MDVSDFTRDALAHLEVRDESGACVATDEVRLLLRPSPVASPGAQYSTLRSGGPTTDVALDGSTSLGEAPLGFAWTTTLGTFADTGTAASTLTSPTLVVLDAPITQRGQACLTVTAGNGCVSDPACADVVVLLEVVAPPHDTSPTLRVVKGPSADVVLSWQDSPVDAGHDAATRHEVWAATRACGPFAELLEIAAQPGANEARDPTLVTAPPLRYYFVRSFNDGETSVPAPPDGTLCR